MRNRAPLWHIFIWKLADEWGIVSINSVAGNKLPTFHSMLWRCDVVRFDPDSGPNGGVTSKTENRAWLKYFTMKYFKTQCFNLHRNIFRFCCHLKNLFKKWCFYLNLACYCQVTLKLNKELFVKFLKHSGR